MKTIEKIDIVLVAVAIIAGVVAGCYIITTGERISTLEKQLTHEQLKREQLEDYVSELN